MKQNIADKEILISVFADLYAKEYYNVCIAFLEHKELSSSGLTENLHQLRKKYMFKIGDQCWRYNWFYTDNEGKLTENKAVYIYQGISQTDPSKVQIKLEKSRKTYDVSIENLTLVE